jgi:glycosyltransferase involved in cell wall biosynthesis
MQESPLLSIVVPLYNEESCVRRLHTIVVEALEALGRPFEMIFVDDGSKDRTLEIATSIANEDPRLTVVSFRRNSGQTAAMVAGVNQARGQIIVTMDGDLQNDPQDIGTLLALIEEGSDIAVGWRSDRKDNLLLRRVPSVVANWLIGRITGVMIHDNGCSLKAYRASLIKSIPLYVEMHRFIPAMASIAGARVAEAKVRHHPRITGRSKYGISRVYKVLLDVVIVKMLVSFTSRPMHWFGLMAAPLAIVGVLLLGLSLWRSVDPPNSLPLPMLGVGLLFLMCATNLFLGGALGEFAFRYSKVREIEFSRSTQRVLSQPHGVQSYTVATYE